MIDSNDIAPLAEAPEEQVFEFGDQTICRMWRQPFDLAGNPVAPDDLDAMVIRPLRPAAVAVEAVEAAAELSEQQADVSTITIRLHGAHAPCADDERLARLEAKIDALTLAVETLQKTLNAVR